MLDHNDNYGLPMIPMIKKYLEVRNAALAEKGLSVCQKHGKVYKVAEGCQLCGPEPFGE